ncbi:hypothetical protein ACEPAH_7816 [Sanghuangporus vaninii]
MPYDYDFSHYASASDDSYAANFNYSASGIPKGVAAGGLANGMADNADPGVSNFSECLFLNFTLSHMVQERLHSKTTNLTTDRRIQFSTHFNTPVRPRVLPHLQRRVNLANWPNDHMPQQLGSLPEAQGTAFVTEQSFPPLFESRLHARSRRFNALASSTSSSSFTAGLQHQPAPTSMTPRLLH